MFQTSRQSHGKRWEINRNQFDNEIYSVNKIPNTTTTTNKMSLYKLTRMQFQRNALIYYTIFFFFFFHLSNERKKLSDIEEEIIRKKKLSIIYNKIKKALLVMNSLL